MSRTKIASVCLLMLFVLSLVTIPMWAASKGSDEETLRNATSVLQAMLDSKDIPGDVVSKAECVVILPNVKKFAVGIGGTGGRGPMSCRTGSKWSAPAMYSVGGASAGLQVGGTSTDYVLLLMTQPSVDKVLGGKVRVGTDVTAAAGPGATAGSRGADILTYARTKGVFAGVSLNGATLDPDSDANKRLYGKDLSAKEIVTGNMVKPTSGGEPLVALLDNRVK